MQNASNLNQPLVLGRLASDPSSPANGCLYYSTSLNVLRIYQNGAWSSIATGSVTLTGQALTLHNIIVGNASNLSAAVDTSSAGQVLADATNGLTIQSGAITNTMVNASAAIAYSKLAALTANVVLVSNGSGFVSASAVTTTTLGFLDATSSIQTQLNGKANTALSNIASTALSADLLPGIDANYNLGNSSFSWLTANIRALRNTSNQTVINVSVSNLLSNSGVVMLDWSTAANGLDVNTHKIINVVDPVNAQDAATKNYVDTHSGTASSALDGTFTINNTTDPTKKIAFSAAGITAANTRTITMPDANVNLGLVNTSIQAGGSVAFTANQPMGGNKLTGLAAGTTAGDSVRYEQAVLVSGVNAFTANQSLGGNKLTNLADPTSAQDAATKNYVDVLSQGIAWKAPVRAISTSNITLSAPQTIDGVSLIAGDRVLVAGQTTQSANGIYVVAAGSWARSSDATTGAQLVAAAVFVDEGTTNALTSWVQQAAAPITIGTTALTFAKFSSATPYTFRNGLTQTGQIIDVTAGDTSLTSTTGSLVVNLNASGAIVTSSGLKINLESSNPTLQISSNQLGVKLDAARAITTGASGIGINVDNTTLDISANAIEIKSGGVSNAQVSGTAAIAYSKLATLTGNMVLISNSSGFVTASTVNSTTLSFLDATSSIQTQLNGKANLALSNLASTAVNVDIIPGANNSINLGSASLNYASLHSRSMVSDNNINIQAGPSENFDLQIGSRRVKRSQDLTNYITEEYIDATTLAANTSTSLTGDFVFTDSTFRSVLIEYAMQQATTGDSRIGKLRLTVNATSHTVSITDDYTETADIQITPSATNVSGTVTISFANANATNSVSFRADMKSFRA